MSLDADRDVGPVAASQLIFAGALIVRNASGDLVKGLTATGLAGAGVAVKRCDNSGGSAGDLTVEYSRQTARLANSGAADAIAAAEIDDVCYIVDDQTVAKTDGTGTRSPAGLIAAVDASGVWVRIDETLAALAVA